jgi:effector-binding domain-containing protein
MKKKNIGWLAVILMMVLIGLSGAIMSDVEQAKYKVIESHNNIEIREYTPMIVAEVEVTGTREEAIKQGFRMIADYIFGDNTPAKKIAMTAPVTQTEGEKIAMTAPVIQTPSEKIPMTAPVIQQANNDTWKIRFIMPQGYTLTTLPVPKNDAVKLKQIAEKRFVVIRFSGLPDHEKLQQHQQTLSAFIQEKRLKASPVATYAFYNPPWTLPFLRRNEVMFEVAK